MFGSRNWVSIGCFGLPIRIVKVAQITAMQYQCHRISFWYRSKRWKESLGHTLTRVDNQHTWRTLTIWKLTTRVRNWKLKRKKTNAHNALTILRNFYCFWFQRDNAKIYVNKLFQIIKNQNNAISLICYFSICANTRKLFRQKTNFRKIKIAINIFETWSERCFRSTAAQQASIVVEWRSSSSMMLIEDHTQTGRRHDSTSHSSTRTLIHFRLIRSTKFFYFLKYR